MSKMNDGASSSRRGGGGETVVMDQGQRRSTCGYCKTPSYTSMSHGLSAQSIKADDYQDLLDRGWRRSGCFLYKPEMESTCCPPYTIRLKACDFVPSKEQVRVQKKMQRWVTFDIARPLLDKKSYVVLSDFATRPYQASSTGTSIPDYNGPNMSSSNERGEAGADHEVLDADEDNKSDVEVSREPLRNELMMFDVGNILIDLHGSRLRFKNLRQVFGPTDKRFIRELELQLQRFVTVVGNELSSRIVYSLG